ncbi:MAG: carbohydrate binding family 9 domain-containing protein [Bacteroidales bacterium]|nr:carbohydrate binding family 9 domain-containing protein [Bacteroidales bacterium]
MKNTTIYIILLLAIPTLIIRANPIKDNKKNIYAIRTAKSPNIDGILDEQIWKDSYCAKNFVQINPRNGEQAIKQTEVKFTYDNQALYVSAILFDKKEDITSEFSIRDQFNVSDYFGIYLDPFNDSKNAYGFFVTVEGVQIDVRANDTGHGFDTSWDAVWESETKITDQGWVVEFKIPYSALRFPNEANYPWGLQIIRYNQKIKEESSWNFIDVEISGKNHQAGLLKGIQDIKPPIRLSILPYISSYVEKYSESKNPGYSYKGGMDLKWGISESFTLDMILIPDFGQVQSDDAIKNLSPFELWQSEQRQYFQEGVELFRKGGIFYSRRIGTQPIIYNNPSDQLNTNEILVENPTQSNLINSSKITGKTENGLGIGIFNAITANINAQVRDTLTQQIREIETSPVTNYNMVVLDQSIGKHSFVSLANTNVYRGTDDPMANVSATDFRIADPSNTYSFEAQAALSQKYDPTNATELGYKYSFSTGKTSGKFKTHIWQNVESDTYDPNDMGFLRENNEISSGIVFKYNEHQPKGKTLRWNTNLRASYSTLYKPLLYNNFNIGGGINSTFINSFSCGFNFSVNPIEQHDHYESRNQGWIYKKPSNYSLSHWGSPDYRNKFIIDYSFSFFKTIQHDENMLSMNLKPRLRLSDKLMIINELQLKHQNNNRGYATDSLQNNNQQIILFGQRNINNFTNTLNANYILNNKTSLSFRMRYYWMNADYNEYFKLNSDGYLEDSEYTQNHDFNFNAFNIDMVFLWNFAPGSEMTLVWKKAIQHSDNGDALNLLENMNNTFDSPTLNSLSVKVLYYLDYESIRKKLTQNLS